MVAAGVGSAAKVSDVALEMACGPVSDSISTELMKSTLQAAPCFSRSVVELAGPELSFDSSVGSETKIQLVIKTQP